MNPRQGARPSDPPSIWPVVPMPARMLDDLKAWEGGDAGAKPGLLVVLAGTPEANRAMGLKSPVALDSDFAVGRSFGAGGTPSAVLVDAEGRIASQVAVGAQAVLAIATPVEASPGCASLARPDKTRVSKILGFWKARPDIQAAWFSERLYLPGRLSKTTPSSSTGNRCGKICGETEGTRRCVADSEAWIGFHKADWRKRIRTWKDGGGKSARSFAGLCHTTWLRRRGTANLGRRNAFCIPTRPIDAAALRCEFLEAAAAEKVGG
jgi:hypothetical protein